VLRTDFPIRVPRQTRSYKQAGFRLDTGLRDVSFLRPFHGRLDDGLPDRWSDMGKQYPLSQTMGTFVETFD
jgi:hypothetical protein